MIAHAPLPPPACAAVVDPFTWAQQAVFETAELDCATAVMLKILDGKCRMAEDEKPRMVALYDAVRGRYGERPEARLGASFHALIVQARNQPSALLLEAVYEQRVLAETMISRPVMKAFKARLRREGVLPAKPPGDAVEELS